MPSFILRRFQFKGATDDEWGDLGIYDVPVGLHRDLAGRAILDAYNAIVSQGDVNHSGFAEFSIWRPSDYERDSNVVTVLDATHRQYGDFYGRRSQWTGNFRVESNIYDRSIDIATFDTEYALVTARLGLTRRYLDGDGVLNPPELQLYVQRHDLIHSDHFQAGHLPINLPRTRTYAGVVLGAHTRGAGPEIHQVWLSAAQVDQLLLAIDYFLETGEVLR